MLDYIGGYLYILSICIFIAVVPAIIFGILASGRGYPFLRYFGTSLIMFVIAVFIPFVLNQAMFVTGLFMAVSAAVQIWYLRTKMKRKIKTYTRVTSDDN